MTPKRNKWQCSLCKDIRRVRTYPRSNCKCEIKKPNKHMMLRWRIIDGIRYWVQQKTIIAKGYRWIRILENGYFGEKQL